MILFNKLLQLIKPMKKISFDWKFYIETHKDLREAGIDTEEKAIAHWKKFGRREGRIFCSDKKEPVSEEVNDSQLLKLEPVVEPTPEPVVEPTPEPVVEQTPEPVVEPTPEPVVEPVAEEEEPEETEEGEETEEPEEGEETEYEEETEEEEEEEFDDKENVVEREIVIN